MADDSAAAASAPSSPRASASASVSPSLPVPPAVSPSVRGGRRGRGSGRGRGAGARQRDSPTSTGKNKPVKKPKRPSKKPTPTLPAELSPLERLVQAIRLDDQPAFEALLHSPDMDVNRRTPQGDAPLVEACRYARVSMATRLLQEHKANVNVAASNRSANRVGLSPLTAACMALHPELVELLLTQPTRVNILQTFGRVNAAMVCVLFCVANGRTDAQNERALTILSRLLRYAKEQGQLAKLLAAKPDKVNQLVHVATALGNWRVLRFLRSHADELGVDFGAHNAMGYSLLHLVEHNSFQARSLQFCEPPRPELATGGPPKRKKEKNSRKRRQGQQQEDKDGEAKSKAEEDTRLPEPQSEADKQTFARSRPDRTVEGVHVTRTVLELAKTFDLGALFSRKGNEGIRGLYIKSLVLAELGVIPLVNRLAQMSDERKKAVYMDGLLFSVAAIYPLSVRNAKEYRALWCQALEKKPSVDLSHKLALTESGDNEEDKRAPTELSAEGFKLISSSLLLHQSLSRRVKVWTLVLMQALAPYAGGSPLLADQRPVMEECGQLQFYQRIADSIYRSGAKLAFCIFDRTDIEDDESYDEEIEFHLLIALLELFLQFFVPYARSIRNEVTADPLGIAESFRCAIAPVKKLWYLVNAGMSSVDDIIATPQRFSLVLHVLQVFEQLDAAFLVDEEGTLAKLFAIMKQFVKQEANKKRVRVFVTEQAHLLQKIATTFPLPTSFTDKVLPLKESLDVLIRSDPKVLGMDLYSLASAPGLIRLEHKVDYLAMLAEERRGSVSVSISRASEANYVDFILQQILSATMTNLKGELNVTLVNEPGVGVGVNREFFQIVQRCFFLPGSTGSSQAQSSTAAKPPNYVRDIGSQWLQLARAKGPRNGKKSGKGSSAKSRVLKDGSFAQFFPLFEVANEQSGALCISPRPSYVSKHVMDAKRSADSLSLTQQDLLVDAGEVDALKKVYLCMGRLMGLAIRNHQPLNADFPLAFWKFMVEDRSLSWEDYCGNNDVLQRSLQFVLDHDFDAEPLDMQFEYTVPIVVLGEMSSSASAEKEHGEHAEDANEGDREQISSLSAASSSASRLPATVSMEMELKKGMGQTAVTNANKKEYVELRAQQFFFGHEFDYYKKMRDGLLNTIVRSDLRLFHATELQRLVRGERIIDFADLQSKVLYSPGVSASRGVAQRFWEVVESFDQMTRAKLLTFWSGSSLPPVFGFDSNYRSLNADTACWYIDVDSRMHPQLCPMANTCDRRLILPDYPTAAVLKEKLLVALEHGAVGYDRM